MEQVSRREALALAGLVTGASLLAGCGDTGKDPRRTSAVTGGQGGSKDVSNQQTSDMTVAGPEKLTAALLSSDVLLFSKKTLSASSMKKIEAIKGKDGKPAFVAVEQMAMAQVYVNEQPVTYAAVDPRTFWRYTEPGTAHSAAVWKRIAGGEIGVQPETLKRVQTEDGYLKLGNGADAPTAHIGATAQLLNPLYARQIDAVVNRKWMGPLGMEPNNAAILSMGATSPQSIFKQLQAAAGSGASVQILGANVDLSVAQTAFLTGGSVARAVGSFNYTANGNGSVNPDSAWVANFIRTEEMPIIGQVTGNRIMLPQLRGALNQVVREKLSGAIYQYGGCYVPRFIAGTNTLSFHSFGTAIDLNVADNQRGTIGRMDRHVVSIFKQWGFAWGGDWGYTDPMHFELAHLAKTT